MNEIKIALYGQFRNDTLFEFTYPDEFIRTQSTEKDAWLKCIRDPREDARPFPAERIHLMWKNADGGNYYGLIVPNKQDLRNGYILLAVCTGRKKFRNGKHVIEVLKQLENLLIQQGLRDRGIVQKYVAQMETLLMDDTAPLAQREKQNGKTAYRVYDNEKQLADIYGCSDQDEFYQYSRVLFIPRSESQMSVPSAHHEQISTPLKHTYTVKVEKVEDSSIRVSPSVVREGELLTIEYNKKDYSPYSVSSKVSSTGSKYFYINDEGDLIVRNAKSVGIVFYLDIIIEVYNTKGKRIEKFYVDNKLCSFSEIIRVKEGTTEVNFSIEAEGYAKKKVEHENVASLLSQRRIKVTLEDKEMSISVRATCDGQLMQGMVKVKATDKLYPYFAKGNYEISFSKSKNEYPAFNNPEYGKSPRKKKKWLKKCLPLLLALLVGIMLGVLLTFDSDGPQKNPNQESLYTDSIRNTDLNSTPPSQEQLSDSSTIDTEKADIIYMKRKNKEDIWEKDSIKTPVYKELFSAIEAGNIEAILENKYSSSEIPELLRNGLWNKIVKVLNEADDSRKIIMADTIKKHVQNGLFNLKDCQKGLQTIIMQKRQDQSLTHTNQNATSSNERPNSDN